MIHGDKLFWNLQIDIEASDDDLQEFSEFTAFAVDKIVDDKVPRPMERYREMKRIKKINDAKKSLGITNAKKTTIQSTYKMLSGSWVEYYSTAVFLRQFLEAYKILWV